MTNLGRTFLLNMRALTHSTYSLRIFLASHPFPGLTYTRSFTFLYQLVSTNNELRTYTTVWRVFLVFYSCELRPPRRRTATATTQYSSRSTSRAHAMKLTGDRVDPRLPELYALESTKECCADRNPCQVVCGDQPAQVAAS